MADGKYWPHGYRTLAFTRTVLPLRAPDTRRRRSRSVILIEVLAWTRLPFFFVAVKNPGRLRFVRFRFIGLPFINHPDAFFDAPSLPCMAAILRVQPLLPRFFMYWRSLRLFATDSAFRRSRAEA